MFYTYILYSAKFNRYYIGQTNDVAQRLQRHNAGFEKSTSPYLPWVLVLSIQKNSRKEAMILEKKLKNLNTKDLLKFIQKYAS
jgi:putative endonuclease